MAAKDLYEKDFYKILGVGKNATNDEIKKKYRSLARELHPDKTKGDLAMEEKFKAVSEAYDILSDSKKRAEYDEARSLFENVEVFAHHKADKTSKVETSQTSLVAVTLKIFFRTSLAVEHVADHAKAKIFKQSRALPLKRQLSVRL
ncbi:MAG: hypothetical protein RL313_565 [Actinomycetota bacterium]